MGKKKKVEEIEEMDDSMPDIMDQFANMQNQSDLSEVLKGLFEEKKIQMITDLSRDEIALITRISMIGEMRNISVYKDGIDMFMRLKLSQERKSRKEIIEAFKGYFMPTMMGSRFNLPGFNRGK